MKPPPHHIGDAAGPPALGDPEGRASALIGELLDHAVAVVARKGGFDAALVAAVALDYARHRPIDLYGPFVRTCVGRQRGVVFARIVRALEEKMQDTVAFCRASTKLPPTAIPALIHHLVLAAGATVDQVPDAVRVATALRQGRAVPRAAPVVRAAAERLLETWGEDWPSAPTARKWCSVAYDAGAQLGRQPAAVLRELLRSGFTTGAYAYLALIALLPCESPLQQRAREAAISGGVADAHLARAVVPLLGLPIRSVVAAACTRHTWGRVRTTSRLDTPVGALTGRDLLLLAEKLGFAARVRVGDFVVEVSDLPAVTVGAYPVPEFGEISRETEFEDGEEGCRGDGDGQCARRRLTRFVDGE